MTVAELLASPPFLFMLPVVVALSAAGVGVFGWFLWVSVREGLGWGWRGLLGLTAACFGGHAGLYLWASFDPAARAASIPLLGRPLLLLTLACFVGFSIALQVRIEREQRAAQVRARSLECNPVCPTLLAVRTAVELAPSE